MTLETKLESMLPDWASFNVHLHELWREPEGGWSVNDSWTPMTEADRETVIKLLRARWEIFKINYLPKARVKDLTDSSSDEDECLLEVDCTAFATLTKGAA